MVNKSPTLLVWIVCLGCASPTNAAGAVDAGLKNGSPALFETVGVQLSLESLPTREGLVTVAATAVRVGMLPWKRTHPMQPGWGVRLTASRIRAQSLEDISTFTALSYDPRTVVFRRTDVDAPNLPSTWVTGGVYFTSHRSVEFGIAFGSDGRAEKRWQALFSVLATF